LVAGILSGSITALSRAITLIESTNPDHLERANEVIKACLPHANKSVNRNHQRSRCGKKYFYRSFRETLNWARKKVAVLAVDPNARFPWKHPGRQNPYGRISEGQERLYVHQLQENIGWCGEKNQRINQLCEACGFDTIIIETVGVGQTETAVQHGGFLSVIKIARAGDELQGIKRGIMEMADAIVINKADGDNIRKAKLAKVNSRALHLFRPKSGWTPTPLPAALLIKRASSSLGNNRKFFGTYQKQ
jgi:LAO/AO transport system kinase